VRAVGTLLLLDLASGLLLLVGVPVGAVHAAAAFAFAIVIAGHVFMALLNPATRPALRGIVTGHVDRAWAERHHGRWVDGLDRGSSPEPPPPRPRPRALSAR
jgi:formate dehydrogenase subunit gamma